MSESRHVGVCKSCGNEFTSQEMWRKEGIGKNTKPKYCSIICYRNYHKAPEYTFSCQHCATPFVTHRKVQRFCRPECFLASTKGQYRGGIRIERTCFTCGKTTVSKHPNKIKKYCSRSCQHKGRHRISHAICRQCGKTYLPKASNRITFCSRECSFEHRKIHGLEKRAIERKCNKCGLEYKNSPLWTDSRFCSLECKEKVLRATCVICQAYFIKVRLRSIVCSEECRMEYARRDSKARDKIRSSVKKKANKCKQCQVEFLPEYGDKHRFFCSDKCGRKYATRDNPRNHRDRAKKFNVAYEPISVMKVFVRDGWRCQICGIKTPKPLRGTIRSNAPELDHRVPMAQGGGHLWSNVQCSCRQCNSKKGAAFVIGQLPLFERAA